MPGEQQYLREALDKKLGNKLIGSLIYATQEREDKISSLFRIKNLLAFRLGLGRLTKKVKAPGPSTW